MTRNALILLVSAALLGALFLLSCGDASKPAPPPKPETKEVVEAGIFLLGNDRGRIRPCGCSKPLLGGIERRHAFFAGLKDQVRNESLLLAFGDLVETSGRQQELKVESFLASLDMLGVKVLCPADGDLLLGSSWWRDAAQLASFPLVAGNLKKDGELLFSPCAELDWQGRPVVVSSWWSPTKSVLTEPGLSVDPEAGNAALAAALKRAGPEAQLVVYGNGEYEELLAWLDAAGFEAARTLVVLRGVSDIPDLLLADDERRRFVIEMGKKGRDLAWWGPPGQDALRRYVLYEARGSDRVGSEILGLYRELVKEEGLLAAFPRTAPSEGVFAGSKACASCHASAHAVWKGSRHAHAWQTLVDAGDHHDPECVACHVYGFGVEDGFDAQNSQPVDVHCESCHGPGAAHVADSTLPMPRGKPDERTCHRCHDLENSPAFRLETYWPKIAHGK